MSSSQLFYPRGRGSLPERGICRRPEGHQELWTLWRQSLPPGPSTHLHALAYPCLLALAFKEAFQLFLQGLPLLLEGQDLLIFLLKQHLHRGQPLHFLPQREQAVILGTEAWAAPGCTQSSPPPPDPPSLGTCRKSRPGNPSPSCPRVGTKSSPGETPGSLSFRPGPGQPPSRSGRHGSSARPHNEPATPSESHPLGLAGSQTLCPSTFHAQNLNALDSSAVETWHQHVWIAGNGRTCRRQL